MAQVNGQSAKDISQQMLDLTAEALLSGDFDLFETCFHLPHTLETPEEKRVIHTRDDLKAVFDKAAEGYRRNRITSLVRVTDIADFRGDTQIEATHTAHTMSGDQRIVDPFPAYSVLELKDGSWKCTCSQYAVDKDTIVGRAITQNAPTG